MQINSHFSPTNLSHGSRPDQASNAHGRGTQFQPVTSVTEPATTTDTTTAVAPVEEVEETAGPGKSAHSIAHRARAHLASFAAADGVGHNFGWLVSQIARGLDISPPDPEGDGTGDVVVVTDETVPTSEEALPADETADTGTTPNPVIEEDPLAGLLDALSDEDATVDETTDPVVDLVDALLEEGEEETEII